MKEVFWLKLRLKTSVISLKGKIMRKGVKIIFVDKYNCFSHRNNIKYESCMNYYHILTK